MSLQWWSAKVAHFVDNIAKTHELTPLHFSVLSRLAKTGPISVRDIAALEGMLPELVQNLLARLEELELVESKPGCDIGFEQVFSLTRKR